MEGVRIFKFDELGVKSTDEAKYLASVDLK